VRWNVTTDEHALLAAIGANPDDDTVRLVYADWLDEYDRPERAEFIRLQIRLYRGGTSDPIAETLRARQHALLLAHEAEWKRDLPEGFQALPGFRRGFLHRAKAAAVAVLAARDDGRARLLDVLHLHGEVASSRWKELAESPILTNLIELTVESEIPIGFIGARALGESRFPRLERLVLNRQWVGDTGLRFLCESWDFPRLRELELEDNHITDRGAELLLNSMLARRLWRLRLDGNEMTRDALRRLRERFPSLLFGA
jgi:uncharacterized protein (TIGR02996 family)